MAANTLSQDRKIPWQNINATRLFALIQGIFIGLSGMIHGISEVFQGNKPTGGLLLESIGAFTIIPNYLMTGIAAIVVGLAVLFWTIAFIHKKNGPTIFLLLSILLFLAGGGIAQVLLFLITWAVSTRIDKPLSWWRKSLSENLRIRLANIWPAILMTGYGFVAVGVGIWLILTPPGAAYKDPLALYVCWAFLIIGVLILVCSIVAGFAHEIERRMRMAV